MSEQATFFLEYINILFPAHMIHGYKPCVKVQEFNNGDIKNKKAHEPTSRTFCGGLDDAVSDGPTS